MEGWSFKSKEIKETIREIDDVIRRKRFFTENQIKR